MEEDLRQLIQNCIASPSGNPLWPDKHLAFCKKHALTLSAFYDLFAKEIAVEFATGHLCYADGDCAMNRLFGVADFNHFGSFAMSVYEAFDAGEYKHGTDGPDTIGWQAHTLPYVMEALAAIGWRPSA